MATKSAADAGRAAVLTRRSVSRETLRRLDAYERLLRVWQKRTNLVAPSTLPELWPRHLEEGLLLGDHLSRQAQRIVDLGSGGGLPGLVLAIVLKERQTGSVDLIESNGKKAAFLRTVARELELNCVVHANRIEGCGEIIAAADVVTARALAPLDELFTLVGPHLPPKAACLFPKGRSHELEIAAASAHWEFDMVKHPSTSEPGSVVLEIRNLRRSGAVEPETV